MAKAKDKITGVRVYVTTVDEETWTILKVEEEDPNTGARVEVQANVNSPVLQTTGASGGASNWPLGFVPSAIILIGGQGAPMMYSQMPEGSGLGGCIPRPMPLLPPPHPPAPPKPPQGPKSIPTPYHPNITPRSEEGGTRPRRRRPGKPPKV